MSKVYFISGSSRSNAKFLPVDNFISQVGIPKDAFYAGVSTIQIMLCRYATDFLKYQQSQATAVGYHGQPEYIASLVSFFASEGSHHITGKPRFTTLPEKSLNIFSGQSVSHLGKCDHDANFDPMEILIDQYRWR